MEVLTPTAGTQRRVLVFVPRWLPEGHGDRRLSHLMIPILGALTSSACEVTLLEQAYDGTPAADWVTWLDAVDVAVVWCPELYPACQIPGVLAFLAVARAHAKTPVVIGGGFFAFLEPTATGVHDCVTAVVRGPGEVVLPELVAALADGRDLDGVNGITCWRDGEAVTTAPARRRALAPEWIEPLRVLDLSRYLIPEREIFHNDEPTLQIHTGSGCAKHCRFCFDEHNPYGVFPASAVLESIEIVQRRSGVRQLLFGELDFFHRTSRVREIARGLAERGQVERPRRIRWFALGSVFDLLRLTDDDLRLVAASGCYRIEIGSESGSDRMLLALGKLHRSADVLEVVRRLDAHGIRTTHNLLFGVEGERHADRRATLRLAATILGIQPEAHLHLRLYQIIPTTTMGDAALRSVPRFPQSLEELVTYRHELQGGAGRALPWLPTRDEAWIRRLTRYVLPMAYHDLGRGLRGPGHRILRALARVRSRFDLRLGAGIEERMYERSRTRQLSSTFVP